MPKVDQIIIDNWQKGMADSPILGFEFMSNVDITSAPGIAMSSLAASVLTGTALTGYVKWIVRSPINGNVYALTSDNKFYSVNVSANTWTLITTASSGSGNGMVLWQDYVFIMCGAGKIDTYGPISGSPSYTAAWANTGGNAFGPAILGNDNIVYIGKNNYIATLQNVSVGGTALGSLSLGINNAALNLPDGFVVSCLEELGDNLMIGTYYGTSIIDNKIATIFPWDKISENYTMPIRLAENGICQMKNVNNTLYFTTGGKPKLYATNGTFTQIIKNLNEIKLGLDRYVYPQPGGIMHHNNMLYFAIAGGNTTSTDDFLGIYIYDIASGSMIYGPNPGGIGNINDGTVLISSLFSLSADTALIGWKYGSSYGIDKIGKSGYFSAYTEIISQVYEIGTNVKKKVYPRVEVQLADPLKAGQTVTLYYRENISDTWTLLGQKGFADIGAKKSFILPFSAQLESLQVKINIDSGSTTASPVKLKYVRLSNG